MNLNSNLINKSLLENETRNIKYKYSKRDTLFLNIDNEKIRIKRNINRIVSTTTDRMFEINYRCINLDQNNATIEDSVSFRKFISEKEILRISNKYFKNIVKTKSNSMFYGSSYNKFLYYNRTLINYSDLILSASNNFISHYPDMDHREITTNTTNTSTNDFYNINNNPKARIYFNKEKTLNDYHYIESQKNRYFYDYLNINYDRSANSMSVTYPFKPYLDTTLNKIGLKGSYKDSFKFNYPSQNATVPDHIDKNLYGIYSLGGNYRFNKILNPQNVLFTGWTHQHNGTHVARHSGNAGNYWSVGENTQFMFGTDVPAIQQTIRPMFGIYPKDLRFIEKWYTFKNKNNYFGIISNKKILRIFDPFSDQSRIQKILYNYSNLETKHYYCGRYVNTWSQQENHGSSTRPNYVTAYYWDEHDYYSNDRYNYGMHCGYALEKTIDSNDNLGITTLSKTKIPMSIIKKNSNYKFLNSDNTLLKPGTTNDENTSALYNLAIPTALTVQNNLVIK